MHCRIKTGGFILKRSQSKNGSLLHFCVLLLAAALALGLMYQGGRWLEQRTEKPETRGDHTARYAYDNLLEYNGITYRQRKDLTTILLMGIDQAAQDAETSGYRNGGQADFLRLLLLDSTQHSITQIQIDRDTMTPITVLGVLGNKSGVRTAQISLAHGFGDGKKQSCELTVEAVSNLLFGIPIDFYIGMNLDGIATLNDIAGGVTVTLEDDFSALDSAMPKGATLRLNGEQAEIFVRSRTSVGSGTNEARMARQEQYLSQLARLLFEQIDADKEFAGKLYDALSPFMITDLSRGRMINEAWTARNYERAAVLKPSGTHSIGSDGFMQFYVDEAALEQTIIDLFYEKVK